MRDGLTFPLNLLLILKSVEIKHCFMAIESSKNSRERMSEYIMCDVVGSFYF